MSTKQYKPLIINPLAVADDKPVDWNGLVIDVGVAVVSTVVFGIAQPETLPFLIASDVFVLINHAGDLVKITKMTIAGGRRTWRTLSEVGRVGWDGTKAKWDVMIAAAPGLLNAMRAGFGRALAYLRKFGEEAQRRSINFITDLGKWDAEVDIDAADARFTNWVERGADNLEGKLAKWGSDANSRGAVSTGLWVAFLIVTILMMAVFINTAVLFGEWWGGSDDILPLLVLNSSTLLLIGGVNYNIWVKQCELVAKK